MAPLPNWKRYLKFSLVSCPAALFPATSSSQRIRFDIINRQTGHWVHHEVVDTETSDPVAAEDRVKGFQVEDDHSVRIERRKLKKAG